MTLEEIGLVHEQIGEKTEAEYVAAANMVFVLHGEQASITSLSDAIVVLRALLKTFLDNDEYLKAAALIWPRHLFDPRPQYTQDIFKAIIEENQLLIPGANGCSKTYSVTAFMYLDWLRDPQYTMIKLAAVNEEHLKRTLMAQIHQFHAANDLGVNFEVTKNELYLGVEGFPDMGIAGVLIPQGAEGTGRIRGYRPKPMRKVKHPRFGMMTRTRFFGDEGQIYRPSVFKDFGSLQSAMNGPDPVKIIVTYNPDSTDRPVVQKAMPRQGWLIDDLDTLYRYKSKAGYGVLRLDGAKCENVVQQKTIYPGLQSYEGYMKFVAGGGGDSQGEYYEKARGFPPVKGAANIVIATNWPNDFRGMANFTQPAFIGASVDCSYQGEDRAVLTIFRYGMASGWIKENGDKVVFTDYLNPSQSKPRHILQYDQQIVMTNKDDTIALAEEIMEKCRQLHIKPENVGVDGTGNGFGTYSHLKKYFGDAVFIQWGHKATEMKVLNEDQAPASAVYDTIIAEMWFTLRRWFESGCVLISPMISHSPINEELTNRRFSRVRGGLLHVENKKEYRSRGNPSPDLADSFIQASLIIRTRHPVLPGIQVESQVEEADQEDRFMQKEPEDVKNLDSSQYESSRHIHEAQTEKTFL